MDFFGPINGQVFFIVVDSYSKCIDVKPVASASSECAIKFLRELFATDGIPDVIVSDNGIAFTSEVFNNFTRKNLIGHAKVTPYNPRAYGEAGRSVQTTKKTIKRMQGNCSVRLARILLRQHNAISDNRR